MRLHLLRKAPTCEQLQDMLEAQGSYIKLAVDVAQGGVVGGGEYHADCEEILLEQGAEPPGAYLGSGLVSGEPHRDLRGADQHSPTTG
jgi:hypothetical protein